MFVMAAAPTSVQNLTALPTVVNGTYPTKANMLITWRLPSNTGSNGQKAVDIQFFQVSINRS